MRLFKNLVLCIMIVCLAIFTFGCRTGNADEPNVPDYDTEINGMPYLDDNLDVSDASDEQNLEDIDYIDNYENGESYINNGNDDNNENDGHPEGYDDNRNYVAHEGDETQVSDDRPVYTTETASGGVTIVNERTGGALMGSSFATVTRSDGSIRNFYFHVSDYIEGNGFDVVLGHMTGIGGGWSFLGVAFGDSTEFQQLSGNEISLGFVRTITEYGMSAGPVEGLAVVGDYAYLIGQEIWTCEENAWGFDVGLPGLYRVNVRTGATTRVIEEERRSFNPADVP